MSDRMQLIARIGASIATADAATQAVLRDALAALVEDHGVIAAHERRKATDRKRKRSVESTETPESVESTEGAEIRTPPSPPSPSLLPPEPPNNSSPTPSPSGARTIALRPSGPAPDVLAVLEHYRARHPRRKPGPKELTLIGKALSWGYSASDLREAIDGNADDPWHAEKGKHDLGYVLRDRGHIDDARAKHAAQSPVELRDGWFADVAS